MPVLDAKALEADVEGMALLRSVLQTGRRRKAPRPGAMSPDPMSRSVGERASAPGTRKPSAARLAEARH